MRVWLVDEQQGGACPSLEPTLRQLAARPGSPLTLLGTGSLCPERLAELRGWQLDLVVIHEPCWPDGPQAQGLLDLDVGLVVVTAEDRCERFLALTETHAIGLVAAPGRPEDLWLALLGTLAARRRQLHWQGELTQLRKRLSDRIVIERAKGILVQRLGISEEDAYKRLRVISRRQRRPMRDIAQSLLDTESLLLPGVNDFLDNDGLGARKAVPQESEE